MQDHFVYSMLTVFYVFKNDPTGYYLAFATGLMIAVIAVSTFIDTGSYIVWITDFSRGALIVLSSFFVSRFLTTDVCTGCRRCEKRCPVDNIVYTDKPVWGGRCAACLRCINDCLTQVLQYGESTEGRRRYMNPRVKRNEYL